LTLILAVQGAASAGRNAPERVRVLRRSIVRPFIHGASSVRVILQSRFVATAPDLRVPHPRGRLISAGGLASGVCLSALYRRGIFLIS
jgi:hypothetical protein